MSTVSDWIKAPEDWGEWGRRANAWLNELAQDYNQLLWQDDTNLEFYLSAATSGTRVQLNYTASSAVQRFLNAVRFDLVSDTDYVFYSDDGATELLVVHRDDDTVRVKAGTVTSPSLVFNSGELDTGFYRSAADTIAVASAGGVAATFFYNGSSAIFTTDVIALNNEIQAANSTSGDPSYTFQNAGNAGLGYDGTDVFISAASTNRIIIESAHTRIRGGNTGTGRVYVEQSDGTAICSFDINSSTRRMIVANARFDVIAETGATLDFRFANLPTTTNAANAYVTSASGQLNRSTSLRQYKWAISPIEASHIDIMAIKARRFKWQPDVNGHNYRDWSYGFIVEEMEELDPALVNLEKDPETQEVKGTELDLRAILAVTVAEVQHLRRRVDALERNPR